MWLAGEVVDQNGPVLFRARLFDGKVIRRHSDQLRPREDSTDDTTNDQAEDLVESVEPQVPTTEEPEVELEGSSAEPSSKAPPTVGHGEPSNITNSNSTQESAPPTTESPTDASAPELRRSSRVRQPPERFDVCAS